MNLARAAAVAFVLQLKLRVVDGLTWFGVIGQPLIISSVGMLMFTTYGQRAHLTYAVIGGGLVGLWSATLFNAGYDIRNEQFAGTMDAIYGCPTPFAAVIAAKAAASVLPGLASFLLSTIVALTAFGWRPTVDVLAFTASIVLTVACFYTLGMILAPVLILIRLVPGLANVFELPLYLLCGFMFPVSLLPSPLRAVSTILAPTWAIRSLLSAAGERSGRPDYAAWWLIATMLAIADLIVAALLFVIVDRRARLRGEITRV